jgi:hypothetical protein
MQCGTEREAPEGTSGFTFLVTSFLNEKEVTKQQARRVVARTSGYAKTKKRSAQRSRAVGSSKEEVVQNPTLQPSPSQNIYNHPP